MVLLDGQICCTYEVYKTETKLAGVESSQRET